MAWDVWQQELERHLKKALHWHAGMTATLLWPQGEELVEAATPVITGLIKEALGYWELPADEETATVLMYLYPSTAAEAWAAAAVVGNSRVAQEQAQSLVADAAQLGYVGAVTLSDLDEFNPVWWREKKQQDYERLLIQR